RKPIGILRLRRGQRQAALQGSRRTLPMDTPESLLERIRRPASAIAAWPQFVELYTPILYQWARRLGSQPADAADLLQDVFAVLVRELPHFRYDRSKSFRAWLKTILLNTWRKRLRHADGLALDRAGEIAAEAADADEEEYRQHLARRALDLMQTD